MTGQLHPYLVTGAHRTGTTWVGRLLAAAPGICYVSEPLNVLHRPGVFLAPVTDWYTYVSEENERRYLPAFQQLLSYQYHLGAELGSIRSIRDLLRMGRDMATFAVGRAAHQTPLLKDPFAIFSLRWFAQRLRCRIIVTVRHPAAFASGLKRLNWSFDFEHLLRQPLLMRDHLQPYRERMRSADSSDVIGQAAILWTIIYKTLQVLRAQIPDVLVVRHEDLAAEPVNRFRELYGQLGLKYTPGAERAIQESTSPENPIELSKARTHSVRMDSRASLHNWRNRLTSAEVERVRRLTDEVAQMYYPEESWK